MIIKRVQATDAPQLRDFAEYTFRVAYEDQNNAEDFKAYCDKYFSLQYIEEEIAHPQSAFWLAFLDDTLVAYIKLKFDQHSPELNSSKTVKLERIYVAPAFQGQRIGEKMLLFAEDQARFAGADWIWLSVWKANPPAIRFYERCGFTIFGTEIFVVGDDAQEDWMMGKEL